MAGADSKHPIRTFDTGADRSSAEGKPEYHKILSPLSRRRYGTYMARHRVREDGTIRASDNWQHGIPLDAYMESAARHMLDFELHHDGCGDLAVEGQEDTICALIFNLQGYLHEVLKAQRRVVSQTVATLWEGAAPPAESVPPG